ncbi:hypothetical protein [Acidiphilium sp. C61]|jgi:hypothetical protein|uniref:hypothetical protein n=1 Tax=Acidiphilium sp. C61 TaxID=1671485 RepID=UPI001F339920|nr:hypothetical protein [Acidiphilium sp. C61]
MFHLIRLAGDQQRAQRAARPMIWQFAHLFLVMVVNKGLNRVDRGVVKWILEMGPGAKLEIGRFVMIDGAEHEQDETED